MAPGGAYVIEYLAADRGASSFQDPATGFTQIETGTYNKTGSGSVPHTGRSSQLTFDANDRNAQFLPGVAS